MDLIPFLNLKTEQNNLKLPIYFPSISSVKTNYSPVDYFRVIRASQTRLMLISAYDVYHAKSVDREEFISEIKAYRDAGNFVLLDSGNYESYWHKDKNWKIEHHNEILSKEICDISFSYDIQNLLHSKKENIENIVSNCLQNSKCSASVIAPIIHSDLDNLNSTCIQVIEELRPSIIAVPERTLGQGITERYLNLQKLRIEMNQAIGRYIPIHLLGTGNPFSLMLFAHAGADTFDGLEWCQTTVDPETFQTHHFQLRELFSDAKKEGSYDIDTLYHNLKFYSNLNLKFQELRSEGDIKSMLKQYLNPNVLTKLNLL